MELEVQYDGVCCRRKPGGYKLILGYPELVQFICHCTSGAVYSPIQLCIRQGERVESRPFVYLEVVLGNLYLGSRCHRECAAAGLRPALAVSELSFADLNGLNEVNESLPLVARVRVIVG